MKLSIEVEVSPEEVPLALELFQTLRALTENVKFNYPSGAPVPLPVSATTAGMSPSLLSLQAHAPTFVPPATASPSPAPTQQPAPAPAAASIKPSAAPIGADKRDESTSAGGAAAKAADTPAAAAATAAAPAASAASTSVSEGSPPTTVAAAPAASASEAQTQDPNFMFFKSQIEMLAYAEQDPRYLESAVATINDYLRQLEGTPQHDEVIQHLLDAFVHVIFVQERAKMAEGEALPVAPYMNLIPRLEPTARTKLRDSLITLVLKHLVIKRDISVDRSEFFVQAAAFASLVNLEFVKVSGAVSTIIALLKKKENRCAAITMLGKTVEFCHQQLLTKCTRDALSQLREAVAGCTEAEFKYDVEYINEVMDWAGPSQGGGQEGQAQGPGAVVAPPAAAAVPSPTPANSTAPTASTGTKGGGGGVGGLGDGDRGGLSAAPPPEYKGLAALKSFEGGHHREMITCMFVDDASESIISASKDNVLVSWSLEGAVRWTAAKELSQHSLCAVDGQPGRSLLVACVGKGSDTLSSVLMLRPVSHGGPGVYKEAGRMAQPGTKLTSCIRACPLEGQTTFVTGETVDVAADSASSGAAAKQNSSGGVGQKIEEQVRLYDMVGLSAGQPFHSLRPVRIYRDHTDLITCVCMSRRDPHVFLSGSRDTTVRMWDGRMDKCVAVLGVPRGEGGGTHAGMVTSLDASEFGILSASVDKHVKLWDARVLSNQNGGTQPVVDSLIESPALKVAFAPGASPLGQRAAVSTMRSLLVANFGAMSQQGGAETPVTIAKADVIPEHKPKYRYMDIKWSHATGLLYGGCDDCHVDVYSPIL
eukprot:jgi/Mesvir1/7336/Mv19145-RA.1